MSTEPQIPQELLDSYNKTIPEKILGLEKLIAQLQQDFNKEHLQALQFFIHKLAGNAGLYGYMEVTTLCKTWDQKLLKKIQEFSSEDKMWLNELAGLLAQVKKGFSWT